MECILPVPSRLIAALAAGCTLISTATAEGVLPSVPPFAPNPDLEIIRQKAKDNRVLRSYIAMVHERASTPEGRQEIEQQLLNSLPYPGGTDGFPVTIGVALGLEAARERARFVSEALSADIDGDWQVTLAETRIVLQSGRNEGTAAAFILSDADGNGILTMDEIRMAAEAQIRSRPGRSAAQADMIAVFDLDGDGLLTRDEFNRSLDALAAEQPF